MLNGQPAIGDSWKVSLCCSRRWRCAVLRAAAPSPFHRAREIVAADAILDRLRRFCRRKIHQIHVLGRLHHGCRARRRHRDEIRRDACAELGCPESRSARDRPRNVSWHTHCILATDLAVQGRSGRSHRWMSSLKLSASPPIVLATSSSSDTSCGRGSPFLCLLDGRSARTGTWQAFVIIVLHTASSNCPDVYQRLLAWKTDGVNGPPCRASHEPQAPRQGRKSLVETDARAS